MQRVRHCCFITNAFLWRFLSRDSKKMTTLETLNFDNLALKRLPIDPEERNYARSVAGACFSKVTPTPVKNPVTVAYSSNAMELLDLPIHELERKDFALYVSGNKLLPGSDPAAHCYCGHQFGYFSGQLGDGAAIYLGEVVNGKNERWEIQLKGAGLTPYSRTADGRKVMRSSIREFLCSEAMHHLGIPTTRAGSCITSDSLVDRDIFYDGHPMKEKCTVILRIAPTFLRFGSFEIFKTLDPVSGRIGPSFGHRDILPILLDYAIEICYPEIDAAHKNNRKEKYTEFFNQVVIRTARLVALWQCVGFCHGVLNTDNMSILGLTIDYGPFGFLDVYNPDHICNGSDDGGRYSYSRQPEMCLWNLKKFAEALEHALPSSVSTPLLDNFEIEYKSSYMHQMRQKLGLIKKALSSDSTLIEKLFETMEDTGADFTSTFRCLSLLELPGLPNHVNSCSALKVKLVELCYPLSVLIQTLKNGMENRNIQMLLMLSKINPAFAERLDTSGTDLNRIVAKMEKATLLEKMSVDEKKAQDYELWSKWIAMYIERLQSEVDGVTDLEVLTAVQNERVCVMNGSNPKFILRNYIAQNAIAKAEAGDYGEVRHVLKILESPFDEDTDLEIDIPSLSKVLDTAPQCSQTSFVEKALESELPPDWALHLKVT